MANTFFQQAIYTCPEHGRIPILYLHILGELRDSRDNEGVPHSKDGDSLEDVMRFVGNPGTSGQAGNRNVPQPAIN